MLKHIVMWRLKDENKTENLKEMKQRLDSLPAVIGQIKRFEAGLNITTDDAAMDIVLYSEFDNEDDLRIYQAHEAHHEVVQFIRQYAEEKKVVDYICE